LTAAHGISILPNMIAQSKNTMLNIITSGKPAGDGALAQ